jgi:hypothetical protein
MKPKHASTILVALASAAALAGLSTAASAPGHASLLIRHEVRGCHTWSVNGGAFAATQSIVLRQGGWITITNDDVMPHTLVKTSGPAVQIQNLKTPMGMGHHGKVGPGTMAHMGAKVKVIFSKAGVYRFATKPGEDYMEGMKTVGEDYVLRLIVKVT